jgi:hypothetical protein
MSSIWAVMPIKTSNIKNRRWRYSTLTGGSDFQVPVARTTPATFDDWEKKTIIRNSVFPSLGYRFESSGLDAGSFVR